MCRTRIKELEDERAGLLARVTELVVRAQKAEEGASGESLRRLLVRVLRCGSVYQQLEDDIERALAGKGDGP